MRGTAVSETGTRGQIDEMRTAAGRIAHYARDRSASSFIRVARNQTPEHPRCRQVTKSAGTLINGNAMSMNPALTPEEIRVIGCLMEKAVITPEQYPLTLNALRNACNQKSSRDPVMSLEPGVVARTARLLEEKALVSSSEGKSNVLKYSQRLCNTLLSELKFSEAEYAVICLLLLRGAQTPGELRTRSGRLHAFGDNEEVKAVLKTLMDREGGPVVARLPRKSGRMDHEYIHLFAGEVESVSEEADIAVQSSVVAQKDDRITRLETRVNRLERALTALAQRLGETIDLETESGA